MRTKHEICDQPASACLLDLERLTRSDLAATWLGHATVLLRINGKHILTDPVFSERIGVRVGTRCLGVSRISPLPVCLDRLPPIDLVLLSHAHFDHLDRPSLRRLISPETLVVTARNTARLVPRGFGGVLELDWGHFLDLPGIKLTSIQPAHWGARTALDRHRRYNSYLLDASGTGHRVLFGGDTAMTDAFDGLGPLDLAIFGIGAYEPWDHHHANPEQVWRMFHGARAERLLPIHHSTFPLGQEHRDEPMQRLLAVAGTEQDRIVARNMGEVWAAFPRSSRGRSTATRSSSRRSRGWTTSPSTPASCCATSR
ncbi:MAG TPA: MBL fold metallo-hydrolase [Phycisphaerales bacterium]|nr:MBL fold metallo-hydrolase [Phycisphaerales bacterium]